MKQRPKFLTVVIYFLSAAGGAALVDMLISLPFGLEPFPPILILGLAAAGTLVALRRGEA